MNSVMEIEHLLLGLKRNEEAAWRELVRLTANPLYRYAFSIVKEPSTAEDVVQNALFRVFETRARLRATGSLRGYVYRVTTNIALDCLRQNSLRASREGEAMETRGEGHAGQSLAEEAWALADELPEKLRLPILLRFGQGLTLREVADVLGIPEGTVSTRQRTALQQLREQLSPASLAALPPAGLAGVMGTGAAGPSRIPAPDNMTSDAENAIAKKLAAEGISPIQIGASIMTTATKKHLAVAGILLLLLLTSAGIGLLLAYPEFSAEQHKSDACGQLGRMDYDQEQDDRAVRPASSLAEEHSFNEHANDQPGADASDALSAERKREDGSGSPEEGTAGGTRDERAESESEDEDDGPRIGTISGLVVDADGNPVSGASVNLCVHQIRPHGSTSLGWGDVTTDAAGRFSVSVDRPIDQETTSARIELSAFAEGLARSKKCSFDITSGGNLENVELVVGRASVVSGRVVDVEGLGIKGVVVTLSGDAAERIDMTYPPLDPKTVTDSTGTYRFWGLAEGKFGITLATETYNLLSGPCAVRVEPDVFENVSLVDFILLPTAAFKVRLVDTDAKAIYTYASFARVTPPTFQTLGRARLEDGVALVRDLPEGSYDVEIRVGGYLPEIVSGTFSSGKLVDFGQLALTRRVEPTPVSFLGSIEGRVCDSNGVPVAGAAIHVCYRDEEEGEYIRYSSNILDEWEVACLSDSSGSFALHIDRELKEGTPLRVVMKASADDFAESRIERFVDLKNGESVTGVQLTVRYRGIVTGRVVDMDGRGVEGATITTGAFPDWIDLSKSKHKDYKYVDAISSQSDANGVFRFDAVGEGMYRLMLTRKEGFTQLAGPHIVVVKAGVETAVVDFVVLRTTAFRARFVDDKGRGEKVDVTIVLIRTGDGGKIAWSADLHASDDGLVLVDDPPVGEFHCKFIVLGYKDVETTAEFRSGEVFDFGSIRLEHVD